MFKMRSHLMVNLDDLLGGTDPVEMLVGVSRGVSHRQEYRSTLFHKLDIVETAIVRGQAIELYRDSNPYSKRHVGFRRIWPQG